MKRLSYIEDARCLKVKGFNIGVTLFVVVCARAFALEMLPVLMVCLSRLIASGTAQI